MGTSLVNQDAVGWPPELIDRRVSRFALEFIERKEGANVPGGRAALVFEDNTLFSVSWGGGELTC